SLSELKRKAENTENWQSEWKNNPENLQELLDNLDIKTDDPVFYPRFQNEFNLLYKIESTAGGGIIRPEKEALKLIESLKVEALGFRAAGLKQENYANRLNEIEVLTSESIEQWLNETGFNLAKYNAVLKAAGLEGTDTYAKLKYLADTAEGRYYLARAAMEKEVAAEAASISLKIFGDDENIQNNSWLSELAEYYKGDLIEKSAAAVITDRLFVKNTDFKSFKTEIADTENALDKVLAFFGDTDHIKIDESMSDLRELIETDSYIKDFFSGKSFLTLGTPDSLVETETENAYRNADISSLLFKDITERKNIEKNNFYLLKQYGKNIPGIREQLERDALKKVDTVLKAYGAGSIAEDNSVRINKPEQLLKNFKGMVDENAFPEILSAFYSDLDKASENLPGYVKSEIKRAAGNIADFYILKAVELGIKINSGKDSGNSANSGDSTGSTGLTDSANSGDSTGRFANILGGLKELENNLTTSIYGTKQSGSAKIKTLINAYKIFTQMESVELSDDKRDSSSVTDNIDPASVSGAIREAVSSKVSLALAKKLFAAISPEDFAGTDVPALEQAFNEYEESLGFDKRESEVLESFKKGIIDKAYNTIRLYALISQRKQAADPSKQEKETAGVYTLTDRNIDTVYNAGITEDGIDYLKASYKIFKAFKGKWDSIGQEDEQGDRQGAGQDDSTDIANGGGAGQDGDEQDTTNLYSAEIFNFLANSYADGNSAVLKFMEKSEELYNNLATKKGQLKDIDLSWLNSILPSRQTAEIYHYSWELKLKLNAIADGKLYKDTKEELDSIASETLDTWGLEGELRGGVYSFFNGYKSFLSGLGGEINAEEIDAGINSIIEETSGYSSFAG
ncbi:MAG: hypothetical protein J7K04_08070, partial [Spirochaetales bacterium]|nr:hypothetical protein [Spirochaetales bacterium]